MAWLIIPGPVGTVPNRSSSSVPTQRLGIDRTTSWSQVRSLVGKAEPVRGLIRPPGAVMGQHPRTWFSSTTAGFPRADAAWLLRQISSLETPDLLWTMKEKCSPNPRANPADLAIGGIAPM